MNKIIKILLSAMIVSLSALSVPLENSENIENGFVSMQEIEPRIQSITNDTKECIEDTGGLVNSEVNIIKNMQQEMRSIENIEDRKEWFLSYKDITFKYVKWFGLPHTIFDIFTEEEITLICRTVETECYDQDFESKCNVASVILNRTEEGGEFGNSVIEVITKANQFAYYRENITQDTILSVMYAYEIGDTTDGCIAFRSDRCLETWYGWKYMFTDNAGHHYYK